MYSAVIPSIFQKSYSVLFSAFRTLTVRIKKLRSTSSHLTEVYKNTTFPSFTYRLISKLYHFVHLVLFVPLTWKLRKLCMTLCLQGWPLTSPLSIRRDHQIRFLISSGHISKVMCPWILATLFVPLWYEFSQNLASSNPFLQSCNFSLFVWALIGLIAYDSTAWIFHWNRCEDYIEDI